MAIRAGEVSETNSEKQAFFPWVATQILALPEYQWLSEQRETIEPLVVTKALDLMRHSLARALDKWFEAQARSRLPDTVLFHTKSG